MNSAVISPCGTYRYWLERGDVDYVSGKLVFCMLNPSTADATQDDHTIRRCSGFAKRLNYHGFVVVNLFALRSTDPYALRTHPDPVGPDNDSHIRNAAAEAGHFICAWGNHGGDRAQLVIKMLMGFYPYLELLCFKKNKDGSPGHPVRLPNNAPLTVLQEYSR